MHSKLDKTMPSVRLATALILLTLIFLSGCQQLAKQVQPTDGIQTTSTPYQRKDWPHWIDADRDCQNTRQEMLIATSRIPVQFKDARRCTVKTGVWIGPYTGRKFTKASDVDIDHIVPLAHAHRHGADNWTRAQRRTFANDFDNLLVVDDATNQAKSDKAPHEWLPPDRSFWCEYGRRWQHVKDKYRLIYSREERNALKRLAADCLPR
ncbi:HNH endonuclease family protein [Nitrosomonas marina]|uniref:GmrSD restriction endonucleases C-terminal domain-containing protein n=1 Tax=Nitrosomonas marina TaxID=917 RepID=A0A1H8I9N8_9PROT|nr:DUF1524 domain-containing protein [Nitrosomonas marina]SEN65009.1 Protein of unknown function [Nitrosomonas marina]